MGAVYLAMHLGTARTVAVKIIIPEYAARDELIVRFQREAAATGRLRHPNVVNVTDFGVASAAGTQLAYLVMEYLDGQTLAEYQKNHGQMPLDQVLDIVEQIALAVDAAHAAGIIHRDLKPDNVWMEPNGRGGYNVKVLDFGIAKMASDAPDQVRRAIRPVRPAVLPDVDSDRTVTVSASFDGQAETAELKTRVGAIIGTPAYMFPEQCLGAEVDYRADIYSLALIVYELVSGRPPSQLQPRRRCCVTRSRPQRLRLANSTRRFQSLSRTPCYAVLKKIRLIDRRQPGRWRLCCGLWWKASSAF